MDSNQTRELQKQALQKELDQLLERARNNGFVITVETQPVVKAMGSYRMVGDVRDWQIHGERVNMP